MTDPTNPAIPQSAIERQEARMAEVPAFYKTEYERLACELALMPDDVEEVFSRYGYTVDEATSLLESKGFLGVLERAKKEMHENGVSFRAKARAISEGLLPYAWDLAVDPHCPSAVRADLIKWSALVAGNTPKDKDKDDGKTGGGLVLNIQFSGQAPTQIISTRDPITIEQGD